MRTATPFVTCSSMVDCRERATAGDISTPSFMGPGGMTSAPGRGRARGAPFTPGRAAASREGGGLLDGVFAGPHAVGEERGRGADDDIRPQGRQPPDVGAGHAAVGDV